MSGTVIKNEPGMSPLTNRAHKFAGRFEDARDVHVHSGTVAILMSKFARIHMRQIAKLIEADPHQWSSRPCNTCRKIGDILDEPFGCYKYKVPK